MAPPACMTRSCDLIEAEDREEAFAYFFFLRRFVFFAVFFEAAFVFLRFAIVPSRVVRDGVIDVVQSRIDLHCTPITTPRRKNQRFGLTKRIRGASAASAERS